MQRRDFMKALLAAATVGECAPLAGCQSCPPKTTYAWNNALFLDGVDPIRIETPDSLHALIDVVKRAEAYDARVRMTGSGHSFSDVAFTEDYLLRPIGLTRLLNLDRDRLRSQYADDRHLVRVESGCTIQKLNHALFEHGLALRNMGGYDAQTIAGAALTATHGSGLRYGPIASQIVSLQMVTTGGKLVQIEPRAGITNRQKFPGFVSTANGKVAAELIQDDEAFAACSVSLGCMGIVYAVVLRTEDRYWLKEVRQSTSWGELIAPGGFVDNVVNGRRLAPEGKAEPDYYEVYFNPYPPSEGDAPARHRCVLTRRYKLRKKPQKLSPGDRKRGQLGESALAFLQSLTKQGQLLADHMNRHPGAVPKMIGDSLKTLRDDSYVARSYDVFHIGAPNKLRVYGIEAAFSLRDGIRAVERLFEIAAELRRSRIMHSAPPSLRFVAPSRAHLAMMHGRPTAMVEIGMLTCARGADELLRTYQRRFLHEFGARPHWGLDLNVLRSFEQVRSLYPKSADRWLAQFRRFNPNGTFDSKFTDRLGISRHST